jgi:hypothetical protein
VEEFIMSNPSARRNDYPRDANDVLFSFHAAIASSLGELVTPLGGEMTEAVYELVDSLLRNPLCLFDEDHIQLLWFLKRLTNEERLETAIAAVRARSVNLHPLVDETPAAPVDDALIEEVKGIIEEVKGIIDEVKGIIDENEEFEVERLLEHNRYGDEPGDIEFLCRFKGFGADDDLWLPLAKLSECAHLVDEYWTRLSPLQYEIIPEDLSFDDMLDDRVVAPVTDAQFALERFGVTEATEDVLAVGSVSVTNAVTQVSGKGNFHRKRRDGNLWTSQGTLSHTTDARKAFKDFCDYNKYEDALDTKGRNALRNWYYKALTSVGIIVVRGASTCGVVTRDKFLTAVQRYTDEPMHPLLQEAGRKVFHLRPALMKHCAKVCERTNDEMIIARLREN